MSAATPLVETTEDRLRRELEESAARQRAAEASGARENKLREDVARLRADNSALRRAEVRRRSPPSAALYGDPRFPHVDPSCLLTGRELVLASRERPPDIDIDAGRYSVEVWLRNNGLEYSDQSLRNACYNSDTVEQLVNVTTNHPPRANRCYVARLSPGVRRNFLAALAEAREALAAGQVPAGAEPMAKWWPGDSQYLGGRGAAAVGLWTSGLPDDALRCVCEHLAPTSPNLEADHLVDLSQEFESQFGEELGEEELDELASGLDDYATSLLVQVRLEKARVGVVGQLRLVCSRWRRALAQSVVCLSVRLETYGEHRAMLSANADMARELRDEIHESDSDRYDDSEDDY